MTQKLVDVIDDIHLLLAIFPSRIRNYLEVHSKLNQLNEVVLDLGRFPEIRFADETYKIIEFDEVSEQDIASVIKKISPFNLDNRSGIERTLHRISAIRNRNGKVIGLTFRVGRAIVGTIEIIRDIVESSKNILFLGPPGIGKTTKLRETARVLSDDLKKRVIVVDTSNEIAGDGDIPHSGIGSARRMQVPSPDRQHAIMIEAVENHMPQVIIVDEIGTAEETFAARTIAERGVQLVATAHGHTIENLIKNPTLSDLIGGIQTVILGDEEAKFRGTTKSVLERKSLPTFDCIIEIRKRDTFAIYQDTKEVVDKFLRREPIYPETRERQSNSHALIKSILDTNIVQIEGNSTFVKDKKIKIFSFGINKSFLLSYFKMLSIPVDIAQNFSEADFILTTKNKMGAASKIKELNQTRHLPVHVLKSNTSEDVLNFLKYYFKLTESQDEIETESIIEINNICKAVINTKKSGDALPRSEFLRRLQHLEAAKYNLNSMSIGEEPNRRVRVYPK
ncbi:MAG: R3H domain-containing nucleic acid-binding protein [Candidatus Margulisiibacteriota bacterium]|jgi:stage III sporulation protein AA